MRHKPTYPIISVLLALPVVILLFGPWFTEVQADCDGLRFKKEREKMVDRQIAARGIANPAVLSAMKSVPRHCFVPERIQKSAYRDSPLSIGHGQTISQPYIVAIMSELLDVKPGLGLPGRCIGGHGRRGLFH